MMRPLKRQVEMFVEMLAFAGMMLCEAHFLHDFSLWLLSRIGK